MIREGGEGRVPAVSTFGCSAFGAVAQGPAGWTTWSDRHGADGSEIDLSSNPTDGQIFPARRSETGTDLRLASLDSRSPGSKIPSSPGGNSSVGRAQPCQGWGREFESRFPLQAPHRSTTARLRRLMLRAEWQSGHAAACKAVYAGSIPTSASISLASFTIRRPLSILSARVARVAELADAADSSGSPTRKRVGAQGSNSGNP